MRVWGIFIRQLLLFLLIGACACIDEGTGGLKRLTPIKITIAIEQEIDGTKFDVKHIYHNGSPCCIIVPKLGYLLNAVSDTRAPIWTGDSGEACSICVVLFKGTSPDIVLIFVNKNCSFLYRKNGDLWTLVNKEETVNLPSFDAKHSGNRPFTSVDPHKRFKDLADAKKSLYTSLEGEYTLDILATIDETKVHAESDKCGGIVRTKFHPKTGHYFDKVVAGTSVIWPGGKDEKCTFVSQTCVNREQLIRIVLKTPTSAKRLYFVNENDRWPKITRDDYYSKVGKPETEPNNGTILGSRKILTDDAKEKCNEPEEEYYESIGDNEAACINAIFEHMDESLSKGLSSQVQRAAQPIPQEKQTVPDTKVGTPKPVLQHNRSTKELVVPITLDLAEVNTNSVDVPATTVQDGISTTYYYPKGKFYFEKIVDGGRTVWESTEEKCSPAYTISKGDITFLALLLKKSDDETDLIYYERKNLGWRLIEKTKCEKMIEELKKQPATPVIKAVELDLKDVDNEIFLAKESSENGVVEKTFTVQGGYRLTEVYDLNIPVWKSESPNKHCTLATVHFEGENPMLASLSLDSESLYLHVEDGKWTSISKDEYDSALAEMKRLTSSPKVKCVELDVTDIDGNVFFIEESFSGGVPIKTITPKGGYQLTEVYDINVPIWKGLDKERCLQVLVYYNEESPVSVTVNFLKADGKSTWRYYSMQDKRWDVFKKGRNEKLKEKIPAQERVPKDAPNVTDKETTSETKPKPVDKRPQKHMPKYYSKPFKLDTQNIDENQVNVTSDVHDGTKTTIFSSKRANYIEELSYNNSTVWKEQSNEKCLSVVVQSGDTELARVDVIDAKGVETYQCFEKTGNTWAMLDYDSYIDKLKKGTTDIRIDFSNPSYDTCSFLQYYEGGILYRVGIPLQEYRLKTLDYGLPVWKSSGDEYCSKFTFLSFEGFCLCTLELKGTDDFMIDLFLDGDNWSRMDKNSSEKYLTKMNELRSKNMSMRVINPELKAYLKNLGFSTFDLSKCNPNDVEIVDKSVEKAYLDINDPSKIFSVCKHKMNNLDIFEYTPRPNYFINEIRDGNEIIWKSNYRSLSISYIAEANSILIYVKKVQIEPVFMIKDEKWKEVEDDGFITRIDRFDTSL
ncbi:hypothetical protein BEWA_032540 [Theileria equi strain WA]|uniref:Signal peptide-containing protein n=1 Tax=Theileria equi strain WA TaxID=1537102 RepID=L0AZI7_THEEQ|nr:hypothetical protein BEWA_032540 [Theileria equi strain WA]AFZ80401.1 hypothetical protein BEWA_032540 [Theileria equi strain WA]|eukprot:XP_004830067.1 hypothetical protein BEWA_032540 [Theileria equi strain WA]